MQEAPITLILLVANVAFSIAGFSNPSILERFKFQVGPILIKKEWHRLISSGFLHGGIFHLLMNMMSLYYVGTALEQFFTQSSMMYDRYGDLGRPLYLLLYFGSLIGGDVVALWMHRKDYDYSAVGASGAISGLLFAVAILAPNSMVTVFILPMPMWLFAVLYVAFSLFGMRSGFGNIGHSAHLGGALAGLLIFGALVPEAVILHWWLFLLLLVPSVLGLYLLIVVPEFINDPMILFRRRPQWTTKTKKPKGLEINQTAFMQAELDRLLDKVGRKGLESLSDEERKRLHDLSNRLGKNQR